MNSDIVFGLFAICGYQFSPRIADISDARLWRTNTAADYGPLQPVSNHTIRLDRIRAHWGDMLRVAGSLTLGEVRGHDLIRMLSRDGKPTGLGDAFAHYGRIFKTLHLLQFVSDEGYRRMIGAQLNVTEARHRLARKIFIGQRGELRQHYREGMEDLLTELPGCEPTSPPRSTQGDGTKHQTGQLASEVVPHHRPDVLSSELLETPATRGGSGAKGQAVTGRHGAHGAEGRPGPGDRRSVAAVPAARPGRD
ncbi:Tn3 family transposase [Streptomyces sp. NPDC007875]|uniref:Tn3 family transposase n=1 Tax=Streptomyces sp. NPDC007875 TaxID=3364783 RepID=UPI00368A774E